MLHKRLVVLLVLFCSNNRYEAMLSFFYKNSKQDRETIDKLTKDFLKIIENDALQSLLKNSFVVLHSVKDPKHKEGTLKKIQDVTYDLYNKQLKSSYVLDVFTKNKKNLLSKDYILEYVLVNKVDTKKNHKNSLLQSSTSSDSSADNLVVLHNISENLRICFDKKLQVLILQMKTDNIKKQFILIPVVEKAETISWSFLPINRTKKPINSKDELLLEYNMIFTESLKGKDSMRVSNGNSYKYTETNNFHKIDQSVEKSLEGVAKSIVQKNEKDIENILSSYQTQIKQFVKDNEALLSSIQNKKKNLKEYEEMKKEYINFVLLQSQLLSQTKEFKKHFIDMIEKTMKKVLKEDCEAFKAELDAKLEPEISLKKEQFQKDSDENIEIFIKEEAPVQSEKKIESIDSSSSGSFERLSMPGLSKESSLKNKDFGDLVTSEELIFEVHKGDGTKSEEIVPVDIILEDDEVININNNQTVLDATETHFGTPGISIIVPRNNNETITNLNEFIPVEVTEVLEDDTLVTDSVLYNPATGNTIEEVRTRKIIEDEDGNKELIETIKTEEKDTKGKVVNEIVVTHDLQTERQSSVIKIDNKAIIEDEIYRDLVTHKIVEKIVTKEVIEDMDGEVVERIEKIEKDQDGHIISDIVEVVEEPENNNTKQDVELIVLEPAKKIVIKPKEEPPILYGVEEKWTDKIDNEDDFLLNSKPTIINEKHIEFNDPQTHTLVKKDIIEETLKDKDGKEYKVEDVTTIERDTSGHITQKLHEINIHASNDKTEHKIPEQTNIQKELERFEKQNQNNPIMVLQMEEAYTNDKKIVTTELVSVSPQEEVHKVLLTQYQDKDDHKVSVENKNIKHEEQKAEDKKDQSPSKKLNDHKAAFNVIPNTKLIKEQHFEFKDKTNNLSVEENIMYKTIKDEKGKEHKVEEVVITEKDANGHKLKELNERNIHVPGDKKEHKIPEHTNINKELERFVKESYHDPFVTIQVEETYRDGKEIVTTQLESMSTKGEVHQVNLKEYKDDNKLNRQVLNDKKPLEENKNVGKEEQKTEDKNIKQNEPKITDKKDVPLKTASFKKHTEVKAEHKGEKKEEKNNSPLISTSKHEKVFQYTSLPKYTEVKTENKQKEPILSQQKNSQGNSFSTYQTKQKNQSPIKNQVLNDKKASVENKNVRKEEQKAADKNDHKTLVENKNIKQNGPKLEDKKEVPLKTVSLKKHIEVKTENKQKEPILSQQKNSQGNTFSTYQTKQKSHSPIKSQVLNDKKASEENKNIKHEELKAGDKNVRQNEPKITDKKEVPLKTALLEKHTEVKTGHQEVKRDNLISGITHKNVSKHEGIAKEVITSEHASNNKQNLSSKIAENKQEKIEPKEPKDGVNKNSLPPEYRSLSEQYLLDQVVSDVIDPVNIKEENHRIINPINGHVTNEHHTFTTLANTPKHQHIIEEDESVENDKNGNITGKSYSKIENEFTQKQRGGARQSSVTKKSVRTNRFISETPSRSNSKSILKKQEITDEKDKNTQPIIASHSIEKSRDEIEKMKNDNIPFLFAEDEQEAKKKLAEQKEEEAKLDQEEKAKLDKEKEAKVKLDKEEKLDQEEKKKTESTQQKTNNKANGNTKANKKKDHTMTVLGTGGVLAAGAGSVLWNNTTSGKDNLETTDESENEEMIS